jgi:hypothetical protein
MHEIVINLHMHTKYSDGLGNHQDIANAAIKAKLDAVIVTDHNIWVDGIEGYKENEGEKVLMLIGEEVHDQARQPQKNHLLIFGAERELATYAKDSQRLISQVGLSGGLSFLAHIVDPESKTFGEANLSWVDWEVRDYTGIELWNGLSEFKSLLTGYLAAIFYAFQFSKVPHGPFRKSLKKWDDLLSQGKKIVAVGGSDAHQLIGELGPFKRVIFPYYDHFRSVNTHALLEKELTGDVAVDKQMIYSALRKGNVFIGNDLPTSTTGFRFIAHTSDGDACQGDTVSVNDCLSLQVKIPKNAEINLLKDGKIIQSSKKRQAMVFQVKSPGVYRVECYLKFKGKRRGWIFSNPIYIKEA